MNQAAWLPRAAYLDNGFWRISTQQARLLAQWHNCRLPKLGRELSVELNSVALWLACSINMGQRVWTLRRQRSSAPYCREPLTCTGSCQREFACDD